MQKSSKRNRRGAALLLCMLAAAVLLLSSVAMLRAAGYAKVRNDALRSGAIATQTIDGLIARATALAETGQLPLGVKLQDEFVANPNAYVIATDAGAGDVTIAVYLYAGSVKPAVIRTIVAKPPPPGMSPPGKTPPGKSPPGKSPFGNSPPGKSPQVKSMPFPGAKPTR